MNRIRKSPGGRPGRRADNDGGQPNVIYPHYTSKKPFLQYVSNPLDLALDRIDYHLAQAAELRRRQLYHLEMAEKHRAVKRSLENLIYPVVNRGL